MEQPDITGLPLKFIQLSRLISFLKSVRVGVTEVFWMKFYRMQVMFVVRSASLIARS